MSSGISPRDVFYRFIDGMVAQRWGDLPDLYAEDAIVRHPFATDESAVLDGRDELREHFGHMGEIGLEMSARDILVHETTDPEVVVAEFEYHGHARGGDQFVLSAIFVLRVRDGLIVESRDYLGNRQQPGQP